MQSVDDFAVRLNVLDSRMGSLEDKVDLLKETALGASITRCHAIITHVDEVGSGFELESITYSLDDEVIYEGTEEAATLPSGDKMQVFNGLMNPGEHILKVSMIYRGSAIGFFTYLEGYRFKVDSAYRMKAADGRMNRLNVVSFAKKDITAETKDRLAVRYDLKVEEVVRKKSE